MGRMVTYVDADLKKLWTDFFHDFAYSKVFDIRDGMTTSISIPFSDIDFMDSDFAYYVSVRPERSLKAGKDALVDIIGNKPDGVSVNDIEIRITNLPKDLQRSVGSLRDEDRGRLISINGMIRKVTESGSVLTLGTFQCPICDTKIRCRQYSKFVNRPKVCPTMKCKGGIRGLEFILVRNESTFVDYQEIELQENPEGLRSGKQPQSIECVLKGELAGKLSVGQRATLNGFTRLREKKDSDESNFYTIVFEVNSIDTEDEDPEEIHFTEEDIKEMEEMSKDPNIFEKIVQSIAPSIYGHTDVKRGLALQMFSGYRKKARDGTVKRGDIHILLVGDPGVSKSQLLNYMSGVCPRTVTSSGKSSSAAGLTASAVKDESTSKWTIEAGALVLADLGMCCIDEIDKMNANDRSSLHEAMEAQEIHISKAGINVTLKTRCTILAAANPRYGRFDPQESIISQINLSDTLLSRFDLIYIMRDVPNEEVDKKISDRILNVHQLAQIEECQDYDGELDIEQIKSESLDFTPIYTPETLHKYVTYGKRFNPVMGKTVHNILQKSYLSIRNRSNDGQIGITPRQMDAYIRLAEASARLHCRKVITADDAKLAVSVIEDYLSKIANQGGSYDIDTIMCNASNKDRTVISLIEDAFIDNPTGAFMLSIEELCNILMGNGVTEAEVRSAIKIMERQDRIYRPDRSKENYRLKGAR